MSTQRENGKVFDGVEGAIKDAVKTEKEAVETEGPYILVCTGYEPPSDAYKRKQI